MTNKYELTEKNDKTGLYRIRALKNILEYGVMTGDLRGYVESEENLSQKGDTWVDDNAPIYGSAEVCGDAKVYGCASYVDINTVIKMLDCSKRTIKRWVKKGTFPEPEIKINRFHRWNMNDITAWIAENKPEVKSCTCQE
jgi:predicted DNA-binding transcriptional regulator AlpA